MPSNMPCETLTPSSFSQDTVPMRFPLIFRLTFVFLLGCSTLAFASLPSYFSVKSIPFSDSSSVLYTPAANPAYFGTLEDMELGYAWASARQSLAYVALPIVGLGIHNQDNSADYRLQTAWGDSAEMTGVGLIWGAGYGARRSMAWQIGKLWRPSPQFSVGGQVIFETGADAGQQGILNFGFRPQGTELLTLGLDAVVDYDRPNEWALSATSVLAPGFELGLRYLSDKTVMIGAQIDWGTWEAGVHNGPDRLTSLTLKSSPGPHVLQAFKPKPKRYVELRLGGDIRYQRFSWFDRGQTLYGVLDSIRRAKEDPEITGMALDLTEFDTSYTFCWEIRHALSEFKASGKKIVSFLEEGELKDYYVASVADWVIMDPMGSFKLTSPAFNRINFKGLLDKVGIGVDELRFFKYKSAFENLSQAEISTADREQKTVMLDRFYGELQKDITRSRNVTPNQLDQWLARSFFYSPKEATANHLVDQLGRWEDVKAKWSSWNAGAVGVGEGFLYRKRPQTWGAKPIIAVVYALGSCDMDTGIKARSLSRLIHGLVQDSDVVAIVLRVDSPGGSGLASDLVAKEMKKGREKKPIIISQGEVAASGGYWLSAYGSTIIATPFTMTGSIGVIACWFYDQQFSAITGVKTSSVAKSKYDALFGGVRLPIAGLLIHTRGLDSGERALWEASIRDSYRDFINVVCEGRKKLPDEIEPLAQGRVWAAQDALDHGLIDQIGGLDTAIVAAKKAAGLAPDADVWVDELPEKGLWDLKQFLPSPPSLPGFFSGGDPQSEADWERLQFQIKHNGEILPLM